MTSSRREFLKVAGGAAVAGAVGFPAVAGAQAKPGVPSDPVKIGILAVRAGIVAPVGAAGLRGTEWWAERVNKSGGILGRQVQLVVEGSPTPRTPSSATASSSSRTRSRWSSAASPRA